MKNLRIVFMGTPEFAVATLGALLINGINVVAVVTVPDKPSGRGRKLTKSAVKEFAEASALPVLQPVKLKDPEFIKQLTELQPDLFIVVAFRMLPEAVWRIPRLGTINLHASLLPQYRGAAPINHAIINGETVTGITTFFIDDKIDTGSILDREEVTIYPEENAGDLHDRLMVHGARLVVKTISELAEGTARTESQNKYVKPGEVLKTAPKITPEFCIIDWNKDPHSIYNFIRGLSPYPCARSAFRNSGTLSFKVFESASETGIHDHEPGQIISDGKKYLKVSCIGGYISILSLQLEGKKRMGIEEFLRGFRISDYSQKLS
ncbi:MAG TPA: methionyl-tRNA formyltransferase [Bacteroidales bacterium]|nr:methionyl-tRNA formyltransferase [Bacteroidales bacterium]